MILRSYALRHGRQAMPSLAGRSCIRAFSTDGQQPPFPTAFAEPPPPPPPTQDESASGIPDGTSPAQASPDEASPTRPTPAWQRPGGMSPMALWNKQKEITVDRRIAARHRRKEAIAKTTKPIGSVVHTRFEPSSLLRDPPRPEDVTLELLMASQTHMGHHTALWNPANQRYIYGVRDNIHIISLEETAAALRRAARVVEEVAYLGGLMLFVGNRKGQMEVIARAAELAGACHLFSKWVPGTITNRDQILGKQQLRVVDERDRPVEGFERLLLEKRPLLPDLVVIMNPLENFVMLHECAQENIPTIGLIDTDADPTRVTYTIPGNDDSLRSVSVIAGVLGRAGEQGQKRRLADAGRRICTWNTPPDIERWIKENRAKDPEEYVEDGDEAEYDDGKEVQEDQQEVLPTGNKATTGDGPARRTTHEAEM